MSGLIDSLRRSAEKWHVQYTAGLAARQESIEALDLALEGAGVDVGALGGVLAKFNALGIDFDALPEQTRLSLSWVAPTPAEEEEDELEWWEAGLLRIVGVIFGGAFWGLGGWGAIATVLGLTGLAVVTGMVQFDAALLFSKALVGGAATAVAASIVEPLLEGAELLAELDWYEFIPGLGPWDFPFGRGYLDLFGGGGATWSPAEYAEMLLNRQVRGSGELW